MNARQRSKENGQILIIIALGLVVLLGFTSLAIDGGMIYADRRQAQNIADAASLAGALAKANGGTDAEAVQAALTVIAANLYDPNQAVVQVSTSFGWFQVRAELVSHTQTSLMHLFGHSVVTNEVMAISKSRAKGPAMPGEAIIAMGDCKAPGGPQDLLSMDGGGARGGILAYNGGIFINTTEKAGQKCAINSGSSGPNHGIRAMDTGHFISSVGGHDYEECKTSASCKDKIGLPVKTNANSGVRIGDPLEWLAEPECKVKGTVTTTGQGNKTESVYTPGNFNVSEFKKGKGTLKPGIYCITGTLKVEGNIDYEGNEVVLYFVNGGMDLSGQDILKLTAPNKSPCPKNGDPTEACTYNGMALFMARGKNNKLDLGGNAQTKITGTVYALDGIVAAHGGGKEPWEWVVSGQVIARNVGLSGNGALNVKYDENNVVKRGPEISLTK
jgi:hypothetical protein